jgi:hypothetical protein
MSAEIRLYLIGVSPDGDVRISVHRTVDEVRAAWRLAAGESQGLAALVHAGMTRPETSLFKEVLLSSAGHVFVTESARWFLGTECRESERPVLTLPEEGNRRPLRLYRALTGWGYQLDESTEAEHRAREVERQAREAAARAAVLDWVPSVESVAPLTFMALLERGVLSEGHYQRLWESLDEETLSVSEQCRVRYYLPKINRDDPFKILGIMPRSALGVRLDTLDLSVRCWNVVRNNGLVFVRDLLKFDRDLALAWKNFGKGSLQNLAQSLGALLPDIGETSATLASVAGGLTQLERANSNNPSTLGAPLDGELAEPTARLPVSSLNLNAIVQSVLGQLDDREKALMDGRLAIAGDRKTLKEIGRELRLSRERVRQIEVKIAGRLARRGDLRGQLQTRFKKLFENRADRGPLYFDFLEVEDQWFKGLSSPEFCRVLLETVGVDDVHLLQFQGRHVLSRVSASMWVEMRTSALLALERQVESQLNEEDVLLFLEGLASRFVGRELTPLLFQELGDDLQFSDVNGRRILVGVGLGVFRTARAVLQESEEPLHLAEIARRCSERLAAPVPSSGLSSRLSSKAPDVLYFGKGHYGVLKHLRVSPEWQAEITNDLVAMIGGGPPRKQWHLDELYGLLSDIRPDLPDGIDKYVVGILLDRTGDVASCGRFVWSLSKSEAATRHRIDIAEACVAALIAAKRPLTTRELAETLSSERGVASAFIVVAKGRLFRLAPGVWGLRDRDFGGTGAQRRKILDSLASALRKRGTALHASEALRFARRRTKVPAQVTDLMMLGLAQADRRFRVGRGRLIGLASWPDLGRPSLEQAARAVADRFRSKRVTSSLQGDLERAVGRRLKKSEAFDALRSAGLRRLPAAGQWTASGDSDDADADDAEESRQIADK